GFGAGALGEVGVDRVDVTKLGGLLELARDANGSRRAVAFSAWRPLVHGLDAVAGALRVEAEAAPGRLDRLVEIFVAGRRRPGQSGVDHLGRDRRLARPNVTRGGQGRAPAWARRRGLHHGPHHYGPP